MMLRRLVAAMSLIPFVPVCIHAQFLAMPVHAKPADQFRIEILKPTFKTGSYTFPTSALFVTIRQSVEGPVTVDLQVPFGYVGKDGGSGSDWEFRPGNPYLGLSWSSYDKPAVLGFGVSVPILPNDADVRIMRIADLRRFEAFTPDLWSFSVHSIVGGDLDPFQGRSDLNLWIPLHNDVEVVTNYSFTMRRHLVNLLVGLQLRGRAALTGDTLVFGERTMHEVGASFEFLSGGFRPGLLVRKPVQGREVVDWVFGVTATFE